MYEMISSHNVFKIKNRYKRFQYFTEFYLYLSESSYGGESTNFCLEKPKLKIQYPIEILEI